LCARQTETGKGFRRRLAPGSVRWLPNGLEPSSRLATRRRRQTILSAELGREEDFYTTLDGGLDVMLC